jgi:hypothetical protein
MPITGNRPRLGSVSGRCKVDEGDRAMNRAWIPAGALAGVSVAGLIALGPLTDSLSTKVPFPASVQAEAPPATTAIVRVSYKTGAVGSTKTAAFSSGGREAPKQTTSQPSASSTTTGADAGQVGYRHASTTSSATTTTKKKTSKPKTATRPTSISGTGETNGDHGFAGGNNGGTGKGELSSTPSPNAP